MQNMPKPAQTISPNKSTEIRWRIRSQKFRHSFWWDYPKKGRGHCCSYCQILIDVILGFICSILFGGGLFCFSGLGQTISKYFVRECRLSPYFFWVNVVYIEGKVTSFNSWTIIIQSILHFVSVLYWCCADHCRVVQVWLIWEIYPKRKKILNH